MRIVVLGNCQADCVAEAIRRATAPDATIQVTYIAAYRDASAVDLTRIRQADVLVEQLTDSRQRVVVPPEAGPARRIAFPLLEGSFLYPFSTVRHPRNADLLVNIASVFCQLGDVPSALEATAAALSLEPGRTDWVTLHLALLRLLVLPIKLEAKPDPALNRAA